MRMKPISRRVVGMALSTTALAGTVLAAVSGSLPMQLQDSHATTSSITLPNPSGNQMAAVFGLCTAYLNHNSESTTTSTTTPTSTTTSTTAPTSTTTTSTTAGTTVSLTGSVPSGPPQILAFLAAANNESITQFCAAVNPKHAELKLNHDNDQKADVHGTNDSDSTTTTAPTTTSTTSASTTSTTSGLTVNSGLSDKADGSDSADSGSGGKSILRGDSSIHIFSGTHTKLSDR